MDAKTPSCWRWCDVCDRSITYSESLFHCNICNNGDYDLCTECVQSGQRCKSRSHTLYSTRIQKDNENAVDASKRDWVVVQSTTEVIEPEGPDDITISYLEEGDDGDSLYKPLDPAREEIRLLVLSPSKLSEDIIVGLRNVSLANLDIPYNAVSYTWGEDTSTEEIFATSHADFALREKHSIARAAFPGLQKMKITSALKSALQCLRSEDEYFKVLWIDQICINQSDASERSHQVRLMHKIYQCSIQVVTYLDIAIDADLPAFQRLDLIHHKRATGKALGEDPAFWDPLRAIFSDPYWGRIWVQQEIACRPYDPPVVLCRGKVVSGKGLESFQRLLLKKIVVESSLKWRNIATICCLTPPLVNLAVMRRFWVEQYKSLVLPSYHKDWDSPTRHDGCEKCKQLDKIEAEASETEPETPRKDSGSAGIDISMRGEAHYSGPVQAAEVDIQQGDNHILQVFIPSMPEKGPPLEWLLGQSRKWQCKDPRDKVYGLLGFVADLRQEEMAIDYNLPVRTVYANAARLLISKYKSLSFLCQATLEGRCSLFDLPTWIPEWYADNDVLELAHCRYETPSACGSLSPEATISEDDDVLRVQGFKVDEILDVAPSPYTRCENHTSVMHKAFHAHSKLAFEGIVTTLVQWTKTACAAATEDAAKAGNADSYDRYPSTEWLEHLGSEKWSDLTNEQVITLSRTLHLIFSSLDKDEKQEKRISEFRQLLKALADYEEQPNSMRVDFAEQMENVLAMRPRFFIAKKDNMGMAPPPAQPHDEIWILFGCWSPMLLRPDRQGFKVVGDVYLHGYMAGEAVKGCPEILNDGDICGGFEVRSIDLV